MRTVLMDIQMAEVFSCSSSLTMVYQTVVIVTTFFHQIGDVSAMFRVHTRSTKFKLFKTLVLILEKFEKTDETKVLASSKDKTISR